jgi:hypothetical protein
LQQWMALLNEQEVRERTTDATIVGARVYVKFGPVTDFSCVLAAIECGGPHASGQRLPLVCNEVRRVC